MYSLYHFPFCPFSRQIRVLLAEKGINFELVNKNPWEKMGSLVTSGVTPILTDKEQGVTISEVTAIYEYIEELHTELPFINGSPAIKANIRQVTNWFNNRFYFEVTNYIINEKIITYYNHARSPNSQAIRVAKANIGFHLDYIESLIKQHKWLAAEYISIADIAAASHLSVLDYLGDVPWEQCPYVKEWYAVIKSRPTLRPLLNDHIPGFAPVSHYANLDF